MTISRSLPCSMASTRRDKFDFASSMFTVAMATSVE